MPYRNLLKMSGISNFKMASDILSKYEGSSYFVYGTVRSLKAAIASQAVNKSLLLQEREIW